MPSYESSEPYGRWSDPPKKSSQWSPQTPAPWQKPQVIEDTLNSGQIHIERKTFSFHLKENVRGRLLRITEDNGAKRNSIIIPATGLRDFAKILDEMLAANAEGPDGNKA